MSILDEEVKTEPKSMKTIVEEGTDESPVVEKPIVEEPVERPVVKNNGVKPQTFFSRIKGLKICIHPEQKYYSEKERRMKKDPGKSIKFVNGQYTTSDPECLKVLNDFAKRNSRDVLTMDPEELDIQRELEAIRAKRRAGKGRQGAVGGI